MSLEYLFPSEGKEVPPKLENISKGHRSQFNKATTDQIRDNLIIKINSDSHRSQTIRYNRIS